MDSKALFKLGYGLYVVTCKGGEKDNGLIVNSVMQLTSSPCRVAVAINKANYSHDIIKDTGILNVNCLTVDTPFEIFQRFGFQSGKTANKFAGLRPLRSENGLAVMPGYINGVISLKVESYLDMDSHGLFICTATDAEVVSERESMTYAYYHKNVKPKPQTQEKKGFVCKICGYVHKGDTLPADFICPLCKHGAEDFEEIK